MRDGSESRLSESSRDFDVWPSIRGITENPPNLKDRTYIYQCRMALQIVLMGEEAIIQKSPDLNKSYIKWITNHAKEFSEVWERECECGLDGAAVNRVYREMSRLAS